MLGPDGKPMQVVSVEKAGDEAWAGVAGIDRGEDSGLTSTKVAVLVGGDAAALVLFAVIGRINHGGIIDIETLQTALPFLVGWFGTAPFLGGYGRDAQGSELGPAALTAAKCWAAAAPLGLVLRGLGKGYIPPTPFIIVTLVSTATLLVGWRSILASKTQPPEALSSAAKAAARKDKQGNPLEFFQLLMSLTKRW